MGRIKTKQAEQVAHNKCATRTPNTQHPTPIYAKFPISRKAQFLTIDALIALTIIIITITIIVPVLKQPETESSVSADILQSLSTLKIGEMLTIEAMAEWNITDPDKSVIDQIGEFYITNISIAKTLSEQVLAPISPTENIGIWYGSQLLASRNITPIETAENVFTDRQVISGVGGNGTGVTGFSARAFLSSTGRTKYFYFGGYVGEGNISTLIDYQGNITSAEIELVISDDFDVYVNGAKDSGVFTNSTDDYTPVNYSLDTSAFTSGSNTLNITSDNLLNVAGGFVKITYDSEVTYEQPERYYFPGISGIINLYDGFYVPGNLTGLTISLHFDNSVETFLTLGDTRVFNDTSDGTTITITNATLASLLDYDDLSKKTIPLRFGMENVSFLGGIRRGADIFSVTDLSGSMDDDCSWACRQDCSTCTDPLCGICAAKDANGILIDTMLNHTENRIGLAGYETTAKDSDYHKLTTVSDSMRNIIENQWDANGGTCICCGINKAVAGFTEEYPSISAGTTQSRISSSNDDAEESLDDGDMRLTDGDLDLIYDSYYWNRDNQEVGMRFQNINIPQGATITNAYIQFEGEGSNSGTTHLTFSADDTDDAPTFSNTDYDITSRTKTGAKVTWTNIPSWATNGDYFSPNLSSVIQEITDRPGWSLGNSIAIIANGSGTRQAESYEGDSGNAPLLVIEYSNIPADCGDGDIDAGEQCDDGNTNDNDNCTNMCTLPVCGDGVIWDEQDGSETCDNAGLCTGDDLTACTQDSDCSAAGGVCEIREFDGCDLDCQIADKLEVIIVMSDGDATYECAEQGTTLDLNGNGNPDEPEDDAIQAACDAYENHGIKVYSIGFGSGADETTLQAIAECGDGSYYSTVDDLVYIYQQIANEIIETIFYEQTIEVSNTDFFSQLFPDSYIEFNYIKETPPVGLVITLAEQFTTTSGVNFSLPANSTPLEANVISYSGPKWTSLLNINTTNIYNLSNYQTDFLQLGDPYSVNIPRSLIQDNNSLYLETGLSSTNTSAGSINNTVIYKISKEMTSYTSVSATAEGCNWSVQLLDNIITMPIPADYSGSATCNYTTTEKLCETYLECEGATDAIQIATYNIFKSLDFDSDGRIDIELSKDNIQITTSNLEGVPFHFSTEVQVRKWY